MRFLEPYGMRIYFTLEDSPELLPSTIEHFQSILTAVNFVVSLLIVVLMIIDSKGKKAIDWLIFIVTFFSPEPGLSIFIIWQLYKELSNKYEAQ